MFDEAANGRQNPLSDGLLVVERVDLGDDHVTAKAHSA